MQMQIRLKIEQGGMAIEQDQKASRRDSVVYNYIPAPGKTSFDTQLTLCKEKQYNCQQDPQTAILKRLSKFFEYNKKIEPGSEYFTSRKEPSKQSELSDNELIIFGCDFKKLKLVKKEYMTQKAVVINPSNFKLVYPDRGTAWKAIEANAKEPNALANKRESEEDPLPRCWIQMRPYAFHNRLVKAFVRFATEEESKIEPVKEEWLDVYSRCRDIYNAQETQRRGRQVFDAERRREKLELQRQKYTARLYNCFAQQNGQWRKGKNGNCGSAKDEKPREGSRQRSRSQLRKGRQEIPGQDDKDSNCSYAMNKGMAQLNESINRMRSKENSGENDVRVEGVERGQEQGNGLKEGSVKCDWSYSQYMRQSEQEGARPKKVPVITIDG